MADQTIFLTVKVKPNARKVGFLGKDGQGMWKMAVKAAPEKGAANEACRRVLADTLSIGRAAIVLKRGKTSRMKTFRITTNKSQEEVEACLKKVCL